MTRRLPWKLRSKQQSPDRTRRAVASPDANRTSSLAEHDGHKSQRDTLSGLYHEAGIRRARCDSFNRLDWMSCFFDECERHLEIKRQVGILPRRFWESEMDIAEIVQFVSSLWNDTDEYPQEWVVFTKKQGLCFKYELIVRCDLDARSIECLQFLSKDEEGGDQPGPSVRLGFSVVSVIEFEEQQDRVVLSSSAGEKARQRFMLGDTSYIVSEVFSYCGTRQAALESEEVLSNSGGGMELELDLDLDSSSDYEEVGFKSKGFRKGSKGQIRKQSQKTPPGRARRLKW